MKIATCTPLPFVGDNRFFTRDTGLLCRGFQARGQDCVVVMPGIKVKNEPYDLIRGSENDLRDATWWRQLDRECVILYAWGDPRYLEVARAIRQAGIFLIQSLDTAGVHTPYDRNRVWLKATIQELLIPEAPIKRFKRIGRVFRDFLPQLYERRRLDMMAECDLLAAVSPLAADYIKAYAESLGRCDVARKIIVIPHPVSQDIKYRGEAKKDQIVLVGRWGFEDAAQKDPKLSLEIVIEFLRMYPSWRAVIVGPEANRLASFSFDGIGRVNDRIEYNEFIPHSQLRGIYAESKILLCASRYESFHIASAEALCSGCSVVLPNSPLFSSAKWFCESDFGTIAKERSLVHFLSALSSEVGKWQAGRRDPDRNSQHWSAIVHSNNINIHEQYDKHSHHVQ